MDNATTGKELLQRMSEAKPWYEPLLNLRLEGESAINTRDHLILYGLLGVSKDVALTMHYRAWGFILDDTIVKDGELVWKSEEK